MGTRGRGWAGSCRALVWLLPVLVVLGAGDGLPDVQERVFAQTPPPAVVTTSVLQVNASGDDYREAISGSSAKGQSAHEFWSTSFVKHGYRFLNSPVPNGATIVEARLEVYATGSGLANSLDGRAWGAKVINPGGYTGANFELTNTPKTAASTVIDLLPAWVLNQHNKIADVTDIVQELVDQVAYQQGQSLKLLLFGTTTASFRKAKTFDGSGGGVNTGAKLIIRWTLGTPPTADFTSTSPQNVGVNVDFDASASSDIPPDDVRYYSWDFGDGTPPQVNNTSELTSHAYTAGGTFNVTLTVTDFEGLTDTVTKPVLIQGEQTLTVQVAASLDDYKENSSGKMSATNTSHELFNNTFAKTAYRFISFPVPQGATVSHAYLEAYAWGNGLNKPISGFAQGHDVDHSFGYNPNQFSISGLARTFATVQINNQPAWTPNAFNRIVDIAPIVQEIVNRPGYVQNNAVNIILTMSVNADARKIRTFDENDNPSQAMRLVITFEP